jgi:hypothetical protein
LRIRIGCDIGLGKRAITLAEDPVRQLQLLFCPTVPDPEANSRELAPILVERHNFATPDWAYKQ